MSGWELEPVVWRIPGLAIWLGWALACALNVRFVLRRLKLLADTRPSDAFAPPALVLAPVKGMHPGYAGHLEQLLRQDYPAYRVSLCVESRDDAAFALLVRTLGIAEGIGARMRVEAGASAQLRALAGPGLRSVEIVVAGTSAEEGQKVHNLLASLEGLAVSDQVVAFVDADSEVPPDWLRRLVHPLNDASVGVSTGYRWLIPQGNDWPSCFASMMNASVATTLGPSWRNSSWAGSMALTRQTIEALDLQSLWRGALNDDTLLAKAVQQRGLAIAFVEGLLLPSSIQFSWAALFEFGRRQYLQIRVCRPDIWFGAALITTGYLFGWLVHAGLFLLTGNYWFLAAMAAVAGLDHLRGRSREAVARLLYGDEIVKRMGRVWLLERWATPLVTAVHTLIVWSALFGREVTWAGVRYRVGGPNKTRVLSREARQP